MEPSNGTDVSPDAERKEKGRRQKEALIPADFGAWWDSATPDDRERFAKHAGLGFLSFKVKDQSLPEIKRRKTKQALIDFWNASQPSGELIPQAKQPSVAAPVAASVPAPVPAISETSGIASASTAGRVHESAVASPQAVAPPIETTQTAETAPITPIAGLPGVDTVTPPSDTARAAFTSDATLTPAPEATQSVLYAQGKGFTPKSAAVAVRAQTKTQPEFTWSTRPHPTADGKLQVIGERKAPMIESRDATSPIVAPQPPITAIQTQSTRPAASVKSETMTLRDVAGRPIRVLRSAWETGARQLPIVTEKGKRIGTLPRENVLSDQQAPTPYFADLEIIGTESTEQSPNGRAFTTAKSAKQFQSRHFLQSTHDISPGESGGFVLRRRSRPPSVEPSIAQAISEPRTDAPTSTAIPTNEVVQNAQAIREDEGIDDEARRIREGSATQGGGDLRRAGQKRQGKIVQGEKVEDGVSASVDRLAKESRASSQQTPSVRPRVSREPGIEYVLRETFGPIVDRWMESGRLAVARTTQEAESYLPDRDRQPLDGVQGFYVPRKGQQPGRVVLIADQVSAERAPRVLLHEMFHAAISENPRLQKRLDDLISIIERTRSKGKSSPNSAIGRWVAKAEEALRNGRVPEDVQPEEFAAYAIEQYHRDTDSLPARVVQWIREFMGAVRAALTLIGVYTPKTVSQEDLVAIARDWLRRGAEIAGNVAPIRYSRVISQNEADELFKEIDSLANLSRWDEFKRGFWKTFETMKHSARANALGVLTVRQLADVGKEILPRITEMTMLMDAMARIRHDVEVDGDKIAERWQKLGKIQMGRMAETMHESTLAGIDPSVPYRPLIEAKDAYARIATIKRQLRSFSGDGNVDIAMRAKLQDERKELGRLLRRERIRKEDSGRIYAMWSGLNDDAKRIFVDVKRFHERVLGEMEEEIKNLIRNSRVEGRRKAEQIAKLKQEFETLRLQAPYFTLARQGDFWAYIKTESGREFHVFKTAKERNTFVEQARRDGAEIIGAGKNFENLHEAVGVSPTYVAAVEEAISKTSLLVESPEIKALRDEVWQLYLQSLPELSARKHFIHRKKTPGFSKDALRAFAEKAWHDGFYLARLRHGQAFRVLMEDLQKDVRAGTNLEHERKARERLAHLEEFKSTVLDRMTAAEVREQLMDARKRFANQEASKIEVERWEMFDHLMDSFGQTGNLPKRVDREIASMRTRIDAAEKIKASERGDEKATNLYNEAWRAYQHMMNPHTSSLVNTINQYGYSYYLAFSPAAWITNAMQTPLMSMPWVAAKVGATRTFKEFGRAYREAMSQARMANRTVESMWDFSSMSETELKRFIAMLEQETKGELPDSDRAEYERLADRATADWHRFGLRGALKDVDLEAFEEAESANVFGATRARDLAGIAEEGSARAGWNRKLAEFAAFGFHHAERSNREITFIAALRAARSSGMNEQSAREFAADAVWLTHGDYSSENRNRLMRGNVARVITQFKSYAFLVLFLYWRSLRIAFSKTASAEERTTARRHLTYQLATQMAAAGVMGLPIGVIWSALGLALDGTDDDPDEWERMFREAAALATGSATGGEIVSKGLLSGLTPIDWHGRLSQRELLWRDQDREVEGKEGFLASLGELVFGPIGGVLSNAAVGAELMSEGKTWRGFEKLLPKFVRDPMKAIRYASEGARTVKGDPLIEDITPTEIAFQAVGFSPERLSERYDENRMKKSIERRYEDRRQSLLNRLNDAVAVHDTEGRKNAMDAIRAFNLANPELAITEQTIARSHKSYLQKRREAEGGIFVNKRLRRQLRESFQYNQPEGS